MARSRFTAQTRLRRACSQLAVALLAFLATGFLATGAFAAITEYLFSTEEPLNLDNLAATGRTHRLRQMEIGKYTLNSSTIPFYDGFNPYAPVGLITGLVDDLGLAPGEDVTLPAFTIGGHINAVHVLEESAAGGADTESFLMSVDEDSELVQPNIPILGTVLGTVFGTGDLESIQVAPGDVYTLNTLANTAIPLILERELFWDLGGRPDLSIDPDIDSIYQGSSGTGATDVIIFSVHTPTPILKNQLVGLAQDPVCGQLLGVDRACEIERFSSQDIKGKGATEETITVRSGGASTGVFTPDPLSYVDGNDLIQYSLALKQSSLLFDFDSLGALGWTVEVSDELSPVWTPVADAQGTVNITGAHLLEYNVNGTDGKLTLCQVQPGVSTEPLDVSSCPILFTVDRPVRINGIVYTEKDVIQYSPAFSMTLPTGLFLSGDASIQLYGSDAGTEYGDMRPALDGDVGREQMYSVSLQTLSADELTALGAAPGVPPSPVPVTLIPAIKSIYFTTTSEDQIATTTGTGTTLEIASRNQPGTGPFGHDHDGDGTSDAFHAHHFNFDAVHRLSDTEIVFSTQDPVVVSDDSGTANEAADLFLYSGGLVTPFTDLDGLALPAWPADLDAFTIDDKNTVYFSIRLDDPSASVPWSGELDGRQISPDQVIAWGRAGKAKEVFNFGGNFFDGPADIDALHWLDTDLYLMSVGGDGATLLLPDGSQLDLLPSDLFWVQMDGKKLAGAAIVDAGELGPPPAFLPEKTMTNLLPGANCYSDSIVLPCLNPDATAGPGPNIDAIWVRQVEDAAAVDHYKIIHGVSGTDPVTGDPIGVGVTCAPAEVTIVAHDSNHLAFPDADAVIKITTDTGLGEWSLIAGTTANFINDSNGGVNLLGSCDAGSADDGIACYQYVAGAGQDNGEVKLGLLHRVSGTVDISVTDGTATELTGASIAISADPKLVYSTSALAFAERKSGAPAYPASAIEDSHIDVEISGKPSNVAPFGEASNVSGGMYLRSIDSDVAGACLTLLNTEGIEMAFECDGLAACSGPEAVLIDGVALAQYPAFTPVTTAFDPATGIAPFVFEYPDAGRIKLHARVALGDSGDTVEGTSDAFVVRPFAFRVADVNIKSGPAATVKTSPNPAGTAYSGDGFVSAGSAFELKIEAVAWQSGDDSNFDGRPDSLDLINNLAPSPVNALTPDFSAGLYPDDQVSVSVQLDTYTPSDGRLGDLRTVSDPDPDNADAGLAGSFSGGQATLANLAYTEVGSIRLDVNALQYQCLDTDSMDCTDQAYNIFGETGDIGRFFPDSISVGGPTVADGTCSDPGGFTYMDDPKISVSFTLQARNRFDELTLNYDDTLDAADSTHPDDPEKVYDTNYTGTVGLVAENTADGSDLSNRISLKDSDPANLTWNQGLATYSRSDHVFARAASPDGPYTVQLGLDWVDGTDPVDLDPLDQFGGTTTAFGDTLDVRFGRLNLQAAYGSETQTIKVPLTTEYWDGTSWKLNTDDNCTQLEDADFTVTGSGADPEPGDPMTVGVGDGPGPSTASYNSSTPTMDEGDAGLQLSPPGAGNTGHVDIKVVADNWLKFDWSGDGSYDEDPNEVRIIFGRYRGQDRVIYWREQFQ